MAEVIDVINIDVVYLIYNPLRDPAKPLIEFDSNCLVGLSDLHMHAEQKRSERKTMDRLSYKHYKWYNAILQQELYAAPYGFRLQVIHWHIETGQSKAFTIENNRFDTISMIIGPQCEHWFGANVTAFKHFCMHGHIQRSTTNENGRSVFDISEKLLPTSYDLSMINTPLQYQINTVTDNDYSGNSAYCKCDNFTDEQNGNADCKDILLLKITLKQLVCQKNAKKFEKKYMSPMITINEEQ